MKKHLPMPHKLKGDKEAQKKSVREINSINEFNGHTKLLCEIFGTEYKPKYWVLEKRVKK